MLHLDIVRPSASNASKNSCGQRKPYGGREEHCLKLANRECEAKGMSQPEDGPGPNGAIGNSLEHVVHHAGVPNDLVHLLSGHTTRHPPTLKPLHPCQCCLS